MRRTKYSKAAYALTPSFGHRHVEPALAGNAAHSACLVSSVRSEDRAALVRLFWMARVAPPALRPVLTGALDDSCHYHLVLKVLRGRHGLVRCCRYAEFPLPDNLSERVVIYRGVCGCNKHRAICGLSWTLDFDCACYFAYRNISPGRASLVLRTEVPRASLVFYSNERKEAEVIPDYLRHMNAIEEIRDVAQIVSGHYRYRAANIEAKAGCGPACPTWRPGTN